MGDNGYVQLCDGANPLEKVREGQHPYEPLRGEGLTMGFEVLT